MQTDKSKRECRNEILDRIFEARQYSLSEHPRTTAVRIDLRYPAHYQGFDSPLCYNFDNTVMKKFIASLKAKISHEERTRLTESGRKMYPCTVRYVWVREQATSNNPHFHLMIFLNKDRFYSVGNYGDVNTPNLANKIREAWTSALGESHYTTLGLVEFPPNGVYHFTGQVNPAVEEDFLTRARYIAKVNTKDTGNGHRTYGCSTK